MQGMRIAFIKCHGSGNDFALIDARALALSDAEWGRIARALCDRGGPVGADGLLLLRAGSGGAAFAQMVVNADGSIPETCLNGLRCTARAGFEALGIAAATVNLKTSDAQVARDPELAPGVYTVRTIVGPASTDPRAAGLNLAPSGIGDRGIEALGAGASGTGAPRNGAPEMGASSIGASGTGAPGTAALRIGAPGVEASGDEQGGVEASGIETLGIAAPETGAPEIGAPAIHGPVIEARIPGLPSERAFTAVAMPNPHLITFVDRIDVAELTALGDWCEAGPALLADRANVSFVELRPDGLFVHTYERGVGLTNACGTAMGAATHVAGLTGRIPFGQWITVHNPGGRVRTRAEGPAGGDAVTIAGNATFEWDGEIEIDPATGEPGALLITRRRDDEAAAWASLRDG